MGMYIEAILIGIIVGIFRNGRIGNLSNLKIRGWGLGLISGCFIVSPYLLKFLPFTFEKVSLLPFIGLVIMWLVLCLNIKERGMKLMVLGGLVNIIVMAMNGFAMPVSMTALSQAGMDSFAKTVALGEVINYIPRDQAVGITAYFGKILPIPSPYPFKKVLSLGDLIMTMGLAIFIQGQMVLYFIRRKSPTLSFTK